MSRSAIINRQNAARFDHGGYGYYGGAYSGRGAANNGRGRSANGRRHAAGLLQSSRLQANRLQRRGSSLRSGRVSDLRGDGSDLNGNDYAHARTTPLSEIARPSGRIPSINVLGMELLGSPTTTTGIVDLLRLQHAAVMPGGSVSGPESMGISDDMRNNGPESRNIASGAIHDVRRTPQRSNFNSDVRGRGSDLRSAHSSRRARSAGGLGLDEVGDSSVNERGGNSGSSSSSSSHHNNSSRSSSSQHNNAHAPITAAAGTHAAGVTDARTAEATAAEYREGDHQAVCESPYDTLYDNLYDYEYSHEYSYGGNNSEVVQLLT
jgi:hypothetical protein